MIFLFLFYYFNVFAEARDLLLAMPPVKPTKEDQYICHGLDLKNETLFITGFQPRLNNTNAHHMVIFSCEEPGSKNDTWNCLEMNDGKSKPICKSGEKIIYAWAMSAHGLQLPKDVSILVGQMTKSRYLVLQNHYKYVDDFKRPNAEPDQSGLILKVQNKPTKKLSGLYILITDGFIPANSRVFMEAACRYTGKIPIHPYAFRTHTHELGKLVSGFRVRDNKWEEIGRKSPQLEQLFYPMNKTMTINPGDILASRCIMENNRDHLVKIGFSRKEEMCNFYIQYWVYRNEIDQINDEYNQICLTKGWPDFKWKSVFNNIDFPKSASILPGESKVLEEMVTEMKDSENEMDKLMSESFDQLTDNDKFDDTLSSSNFY